MMNTITRDFGNTFFSKKKCFLYVSVMHRWHLLDISARKSSIFFSRVILKWLWMFIVFCTIPKQTIGSTGKHRVKIGWRSEFYCHCCYLLTHSLNSTTAVASPPIGDSSHKKRKKSNDIENNKTTIIKRYHFSSHSEVSKQGLAMRYNA